MTLVVAASTVEDAGLPLKSQETRGSGAVVEDAFQWAVGRCLQCRIDFFDAGGFLGFNNQVDQRDVRGRYANGQTVELAFQLRQDQGDSLGGAGCGRNHRQGGGTGTAHVAVRQVENALVVSVGVDRGHQAFDDAEALHEDLGDRGQTVGGTGGVRDDVVLSGIVKVVIDAHADGQIDFFARCADDDLACAGLNVLAGIFAIGEEAGRFDDDVDAKLFPGQGGRIALTENLDRFTVNEDAVVSSGQPRRKECRGSSRI